MVKTGIFIVFEGIDGSGKSIHIKTLSKELHDLGYRVFITKEPTNRQIGYFLHNYAGQEKKRFLPETEVFLFAADRFEHVKYDIEPALRVGSIVISDRYYHSSLAYQGAAGAKVEWIRKMNNFAPNPDLAILLDILPDYSLYRTKRKRTLFEDTDYLRKVRAFYLDFAKDGELVKINAEKSKREVQEEIFLIVKNHLIVHGLWKEKD